jgi:hypothetical protein
MPDQPRPSLSHHLGRLARHLFHVPYWMKAILAIALLLAAYSFAAPYFSKSPSPATTQPLAQRFHDLLTAPWLSRTAISLLVGYFLGGLYRIFTKLMSLLALLAAAAWAAVSYFHFDAAPIAAAASQEYHQTSSWFSAQATHAKELLTTHLPSTTSAALGLLFGIKKRPP